MLIVGLAVSTFLALAEPTVAVGTLETRAHWITIQKSDTGLVYTVKGKHGLDPEETLTLEQLKIKRPDVYLSMQQFQARPLHPKKIP